MKFDFSIKEASNLLISVLIIGFLFSMRNLNDFIPLTLIVGVAFIIHELSHKFMAQKFDCKAEYVLWPQGVLFSLMIAFLSGGNLIFAAIGYVSISTYYSTRLGFKYTYLTLEEQGKISIAGPASNIILGIISAGLMPYYPLMSVSVWLNFILAIFNLMPFPPLDGSKVLLWSRMTWVSIMATAIVTWVLATFTTPLLAAGVGIALMITLLFYTFQKEW